VLSSLVNKRIVIHTILLSFFMIGLLYLGGFIINVTESYPLGLYRKVSGAFNKGDKVVFCLKEGPVDYLRSVHKLPFHGGGCKTYPFILKTVYAVGGDVVSLLDKGVFINGGMIENTRIKSRRLMNKYIGSLARSFKLREGQYFLLSNKHPNSFDSRYFGAVDQSDIISKVRLVWAF